MLMLVHDNYDELLRLAALRRAEVLDTPRTPEFDEIALAAKVLFNAAAGLVSFVDAERLWFKSSAGVEVQETSREGSFCAACIEHRNLLWIEDASEDPRFSDSPFVTGEPGLRFYEIGRAHV
jgi:GAF domain-containing protein